MPAETVTKPNIAPAGPPALLTQSLVRQHYLPLAERTFFKWVSAGLFPKPDISIGGKARFWKREAVEAWIAAQVERGQK
jgi:predicted DNA-binding transcriptional regulator AlpA